jgi:hypothetical protein
VLVDVPQPRLWRPPPRIIVPPRERRTPRVSRHRDRSFRPAARPFRRSPTGLWYAAPSIAQTSSTQSGSSTVGATFNSLQTQGNANIALFSGQSATVTGPTIFDTENNDYLPIGSLQSAAAGYSMFAWVAFDIAAAGAGVNQVTTSVTGSFGFSELVILEISGVTVLDLATIATASNASSSEGISGPVTTSYLNEILICYNANNSNAVGPGVGWTDALGGVTGFGSECEFQLTTSPGASITGTVPLTGATNWIQIMFGLAPSASGAGTPNDPIFFGCNF